MCHFSRRLKIIRPWRYNHKQEVQDAQRGLKRTIHELKRALRKNPPPEERTRMEKELSEASRLLDHSEGFIDSPSEKTFKEILQQNGLTESYNAGNPQRPVAAKTSTGGSVGGVANETGIMEGLFDTCEALEEEEHYFYMPSPEGEAPFEDQELQQLLQELACGIFVHDTVPFFSLHFNGDSNMYPVIHPAYQNTLVGKVISLLDYYMKGFLNGAFFKEEFLWKWQESKSQDKEFLKSHCIDLHAHCQDQLGSEFQYFSIRELIDTLIRQEGFLATAEEKLTEDPIFSNYSGFRSSFRIIAKQNSIKKGGALFIVDGDFDVFYTIEPDPDYERELSYYRPLIEGRQLLGAVAA